MFVLQLCSSYMSVYFIPSWVYPKGELCNSFSTTALISVGIYSLPRYLSSFWPQFILVRKRPNIQLTSNSLGQLLCSKIPNRGLINPGNQLWFRSDCNQGSLSVLPTSFSPKSLTMNKALLSLNKMHFMTSLACRLRASAIAWALTEWYCNLNSSWSRHSILRFWRIF